MGRLTEGEAFDELRKRFQTYIDNDVLSKTRLPQIGKFYRFYFVLTIS